jgi:hypothetical protein
VERREALQGARAFEEIHARARDIREVGPSVQHAVTPKSRIAPARGGKLLGSALTPTFAQLRRGYSDVSIERDRHRSR